MKLGVLWQKMDLGNGVRPTSNSYYRAIEPMRALERRGHEIVWPRDAGSTPELKRLIGCDVVHVYRDATDPVRRVLAQLAERGTAITYDNDDDFSAVPKESPYYKQSGGLKGSRIFSETVKAARMASAFTTPSEALAEKYRRAGAQRVEVIANHVAPAWGRRRRRRHNGLVVGWIAGGEHRADAGRIKIADALRALQAKHPDVHVECIGVDLKLAERYRHDRWLDLAALPERIAGFDIAIAPLADIAYNRTRSDIKLKEYSACGVPWLASPIGPYVGLGEGEGGRLVADDEWFEALERLIASRRERKRLARRGKAWAKHHTIAAAAERWEQLFESVTHEVAHLKRNLRLSS